MITTHLHFYGSSRTERMFFVFINAIICSSSLSYGYKTIRSVSEPNLYITLRDGILRLKESHEPLIGMESNMVKFEGLGDGLRIIVNEKAICKAGENNDMVVACDIATNKNTEWTVTNKSGGEVIETDGFCLTKDELDTRMETRGYRLSVEKCSKASNYMWKISEVDPMIYNGNLGEDVHSFAMPTPYVNFLGDKSTKKLYRLIHPPFYRAKERPEDARGVF
ncbi:hypothetical protein THOM_1843 [Trachipleistophora hominis]|uniref:Uncharacterized protein n=1 Tax=Trachipleistophora hominis TaxID=72359 RepID=L7JVA1_TRAHO|nr:hypothetical protein THOM_1843 [Trachipleistophora hominis]